MSNLKSLVSVIRNQSNETYATHSQRFFKTGPGEYGEGDIFLGIRVPVLRKIAKKHRSLSLDSTIKLLHSEYHEERLTALIIMTLQFERANESDQKSLFDAYLENTDYINSWDLVDVSAHKITGAYLRDKDHDLLFSLARSKKLWERRIAIISTYDFIRQNQFDSTLKIAKILLGDSEDLIHKAVGWMLREVGNRNLDIERKFLSSTYKQMPRIMLRYAIERFEEPLRQKYLKGLI